METNKPDETRFTLMERIPSGAQLVSQSGEKIIVDDLISDSGGQGDVYRVTYQGNPYALKWYNKNKADVIGGDLYQNILTLRNTPKPSEKFIWPLEIVKQENSPDSGLFGYLMELFPDGYAEMNDFLRPDGDGAAVRFQSYNAMLSAGLNIAAAMRELHVSLGMSYKDLNPKNFAFHPETGDILVIDNDNVSADGRPCGISGMSGYMAPEIQRSGYKVPPSIQTDYFSLAVIMFRLFFMDHPFDGRRMRNYAVITDRVEERLYAREPVFCFDPNDESNRPDQDYAPNAAVRWRVMPLELRRLFIEAFTQGIDRPGLRPPENAWIAAIAQTRDKLIRVSMRTAQGAVLREQFVNFDHPNSVPPECLLLSMSSGYDIALYPKKAIYEISVDGDANRYRELCAGVVYYSNRRRMGLRNLSDEEWQVFTPDSAAPSIVRKNQEAELVPGVSFDFRPGKGRAIGIVKLPPSRR